MDYEYKYSTIQHTISKSIVVTNESVCLLATKSYFGIFLISIKLLSSIIIHFIAQLHTYCRMNSKLG